MILQIPGSELVRLLSALSEESRLGETERVAGEAVTLAPAYPVSPCECGSQLRKTHKPRP